jgi:hypothetical protein
MSIAIRPGGWENEPVVVIARLKDGGELFRFLAKTSICQSRI